MKQTFLYGICAAIIGGVGLWFGALIGAEVAGTAVGVGGGVILALVRLGTPLERFGGYLIGLALGVFYAAMQLGLLPGGASTAGNAVALGVVMLVITAVTTLTRRRIAAWSMLLGAMTFLCGFSGVIQATPWTASQQISLFLLSVLSASMIGFLTVVPVEFIAHRKPKDKSGDATDDPNGQPDQPEGQLVGADGSPAPTAGIEILGGGR